MANFIQNNHFFIGLLIGSMLTCLLGLFIPYMRREKKRLANAVSNIAHAMWSIKRKLLESALVPHDDKKRFRKKRWKIVLSIISGILGVISLFSPWVCERIIPQHGTSAKSIEESASTLAIHMFRGWEMKKEGRRVPYPYRTTLMLVHKENPASRISKKTLSLQLEGDRFHVQAEWFAGLGYEVVWDRPNGIMMLRHPKDHACIAFNKDEIVVAYWNTNLRLFEAWWGDKLGLIHFLTGDPTTKFLEADCYPIPGIWDSKRPEAPMRVFVGAMNLSPKDYAQGGSVKFTGGNGTSVADGSIVKILVPAGNEIAQLAQGKIIYRSAPSLVVRDLGRKGRLQLRSK